MSRNGDHLSSPLELAYWHQLLNFHYPIQSEIERNINCVYAAAKLLQIVVDMLYTIKIESLPNSEFDRVYKLQQHCNSINTLLLRPTANHDAIVEGSNEAVDELCYLLQMANPRLAIAIEQLCQLLEENTWLIPTMMTYSDS